MKKGVITIFYSKRLADHVALMMHDKLHMYKFKTDGYFPLVNPSTGEEIGKFVCVCGPKLVVRFLELITDFGMHREEYLVNKNNY